MAFATQEDVFAVGEKVISELFKTFSKKPVNEAPYPRISYAEAMLKYGTDKPDLRNPLFIVDVSDLFVNSDFKPFSNKTVRAIRVPNMAEKSKTFFKNMEEYALSIGMGGLGYFKVAEDFSFQGPIDKFLKDSDREELKRRMQLCVGEFYTSSLTTKLMRKSMLVKSVPKLQSVWDSLTNLSSVVVGFMTSPCTNRMRIQENPLSPTTPSLCRRENWKRLRPKIRMIFWRINMTLSLTVLKPLQAL